MAGWAPTSSGSTPCGGPPRGRRGGRPPASSWCGRWRIRPARSGDLDPLAAGDRGDQPRVAARPGPAPAPEDGPPAARPPRLAGARGAPPRRPRRRWAGPSSRVVLLRLDVLAAQDRLDEARTLLARSLDKEPRNLGYRLAMARLTQRQGAATRRLRIIDQAEKDLGPSPRIDLARLDYWGRRGGDAARGAVAKLAAARGQVPAADRPAFLRSPRRGRDPARPAGPGAAILARAGGPAARRPPRSGSGSSTWP